MQYKDTKYKDTKYKDTTDKKMHAVHGCRAAEDGGDEHNARASAACAGRGRRLNLTWSRRPSADFQHETDS